MSEQSSRLAATRSRRTDRSAPKRSRKGCPECKTRKIKCDEARPQCGQCQRSGRKCHIATALFRPHALSSEVVVPQVERLDSAGDNEHADAFGQGQYRKESDSGRPEVSEIRYESQHLPESNTELVRSGNGRAREFSPRSASEPVTSTREEDKLEESFLIRYFSENIAPWLDLFNFQRYFGHECIVLIRENSLLRFAMCALSAKQLGHCLPSGISQSLDAAQSRSFNVLLQRGSSFAWYGAKYYDKAIKTLVRQIESRENYPSQASPASVASMTFSQGDLMTKADGEDPIVRLLATCLLIQFENLSGNTKGWKGHLDGFAKLLALLNNDLFYTNPWSRQVLDAKGQRALRAAFWWYVINDLEESFVARRPVRVDLDNVETWRHMGLHMHDNGDLIDLDSSVTPDAPPHLQEDLLSFALIRLLAKLINALALPQSNSQTAYSPSYIVPELVSGDDVTKFRQLEQDIDKWMSDATASFQPDEVSNSLDLHANGMQSAFSGTQKWYSHAFRAVTMLYYHMAKTMLLANQPVSLLRTQGSPLGQSYDLLKVLRGIEQQMQTHAAEIISIVHGMLEDGAVRVRAIQPLYVAGRSLTNKNDRGHVIGLLRSTQDKFGLMCEYQVQHLIQEWNVTFADLDLTDPAESRRTS